jgi:hypothetical protein
VLGPLSLRPKTGLPSDHVIRLCARSTRDSQFIKENVHLLRSKKKKKRVPQIDVLAVLLVLVPS